MVLNIRHAGRASLIGAILCLGCTPIESPPAADPPQESAAETQPLQEERPETCMAPLPPAAEAADAPASPIAPQETQIATEAVRHFEILCPDLLTPDFVASVQRALAARGFFTGPVTGELDTASRAAIAAYQAEQGLESDALSLAAARRLGLVAVERPVDN